MWTLVFASLLLTRDALDDRTGDQVDPQLARRCLAPSRCTRPSSGCGAGRHLGTGAEDAPLLRQHDELRSLLRGLAHQPIGGEKVLLDVLGGVELDGAGAQVALLGFQLIGSRLTGQSTMQDTAARRPAAAAPHPPQPNACTPTRQKNGRRDSHQPYLSHELDRRFASRRLEQRRGNVEQKADRSVGGVVGAGDIRSVQRGLPDVHQPPVRQHQHLVSRNERQPSAWPFDELDRPPGEPGERPVNDRLFDLACHMAHNEVNHSVG